MTTGKITIDLPTPLEVAEQLDSYFSADQAKAIAEYVYQPLSRVLITYIVASIK